MVAQAGQLDGELDLDGLPHLDEEGRIPSGHRRSVGGTLVLPAEGAVVDLVCRDRGAPWSSSRRGPPNSRTTRLGIAAIAHALANAAEGVRSHGRDPTPGDPAGLQAGLGAVQLLEDEVLRRGGALFDDGMYWEAHEVWEVWRMRKGRPDRDFLKGIIQGAAGM